MMARTTAPRRPLARLAPRFVFFPQNRGKGAALREAFSILFSRGFDAVVTIDADGQHLPEEVPRLLAVADERRTRPGHARSSVRGNGKRAPNEQPALVTGDLVGRGSGDLRRADRLPPLYACADRTHGVSRDRFRGRERRRRARRAAWIPRDDDAGSSRARRWQGTSHYRPVLDSLRIASGVLHARFLATDGATLLPPPADPSTCTGAWPDPSAAGPLSRHRRVLVPFAYWAFTRLPPWTEWISVSVFAMFFFLTLSRIRGALASNLEPVIGPAGRPGRTPSLVPNLWAFSWCLTERYRRLATPNASGRRSKVRSTGAQVTEGTGGLLLVTAHVGPWETASHFGASNSPRRIHIVREKEIDPRAQQFIQDLLSRSGDEYVTHFAGENLTLALELAKALREGDVVALQCDRPRAGGRTVIVNLFGRPMPLPTGPAALARAANVPILPVFNFRDARFRLRTVVRAPIHVDHTTDRDSDVANAVHRLATEIEWAIRHRPYQWFCFRRLWE